MFIKEYGLTSLVLSCPLFLAEWTLCSIQRTFTFWYVPFRMDSMQIGRMFTFSYVHTRRDFKQQWANVHLLFCPL